MSPTPFSALASSVLEDLSRALRAFRKQPGIPLLILLTLGVGIGATTAVFNLVNALLIRPLSYEKPEQLVALHETRRSDGSEWEPISPPNLHDWRERQGLFAAVGAFSRSDFNLSVEEEGPEWVHGCQVEAGLFPLLGVKPVLGRGFSSEEDRQGGPRAVLLSHAFWTERFAGNERAVGRRVLVDGVSHEVIGVMPPSFAFPEWAQLWTPLALDASRSSRDERSLNAIARLGPGVSLAQAQAGLDEVASALERRYPESNQGRGARVRTLSEELMPREARTGLWLMLGAAILVLLIICANTTTPLVVRVMGRWKEYAVRMALGAPRSRLIRQLLTENLLLYLVGGLLGMIASLYGVRFMIAAVPVEIPFWVRFDLDGRVLAFTLGVAGLTGLVFGLLPALRVTDPRSLPQLRGEHRGASAGRAQSRLRNLFVVMEFALSGVLLISAMLLVKSFERIESLDRGYQSQGVVTARFSLTGPTYRQLDSRQELVERLLERVKSTPGVRAADVTDYLPSSRDGYLGTQVVAEGQTVTAGEERVVSQHGVGASYFETLQIPLVSGRVFAAEEVREARPAVMISSGLAQSLWGNDDPLGRRLRLSSQADQVWLSVIGVVGETRQAYQMGGLDRWPRDQVYLPWTRSAARGWTLAVRAEGAPLQLMPPMRNALSSLDPSLALFRVLTLDQVQREFEWLPRFWGQIFSVFAALGLAIAAIGLYGIVSHSMAQRGRELGIRSALGAQPRDLVLLPLKQGLRLALIGLALGLVGAIAVALGMSSLLHSVSPADPWVYGSVSAMILFIAALASIFPAYRLVRLDPTEALKAE